MLGEAKFTKPDCIDGPSFVGYGEGLPCAMGIDEAGRGPVLGPMVYACAVSVLDLVSNLKSLG